MACQRLRRQENRKRNRPTPQNLLYLPPSIQIQFYMKYKSVFTYNQTVECRRANEILRASKEIVRPLWSPFWNDKEISVLFSETNVGKSILATQIANDIARGVNSINGQTTRMRKVVYFDYELSDLQFRDRYLTYNAYCALRCHFRGTFAVTRLGGGGGSGRGLRRSV